MGWSHQVRAAIHTGLGWALSQIHHWLWPSGGKWRNIFLAASSNLSCCPVKYQCGRKPFISVNTKKVLSSLAGSETGLIVNSDAIKVNDCEARTELKSWVKMKSCAELVHWVKVQIKTWNLDSQMDRYDSLQTRKLQKWRLSKNRAFLWKS